MKLTPLFLLILLLTCLSTNVLPQTKKSMDIGVIAGTNYSSAFADIPPQPTGGSRDLILKIFININSVINGGITFKYSPYLLIFLVLKVY